MEDKIISPMQDFLPGALSKWILGLSIALPIALYRLYPDLPSAWLPQTESEKFLIRILISESILLFGFVSLAFLLAHHNKRIVSELTDVNETLMLLAQKTTDTIVDPNFRTIV